MNKESTQVTPTANHADRQAWCKNITQNILQAENVLTWSKFVAVEKKEAASHRGEKTRYLLLEVKYFQLRSHTIFHFVCPSNCQSVAPWEKYDFLGYNFRYIVIFLVKISLFKWHLVYNFFGPSVHQSCYKRHYTSFMEVS